MGKEPGDDGTLAAEHHAHLGQRARVEARVTSVKPDRARTAAAIRAGWNDAAWGRPRRGVGVDVAAAYEQGYRGGLTFRVSQRRQALDFEEPATGSSQVVPTA